MSGRAATVNVIAGDYALSVGRPNMPAPIGWRWVPLTDVARLESGHTPSREHPEYWDGGIPWIGIRDARAHHAKVIHDTLQTVTQAGIDNSAARVLPPATVCLSRTASVGYVVVMGREMATSQDFVNWICGPELYPEFLQQLFIAENKSLFRFGKGSTHTTIYYPEVKAFHVCLPPLNEQRRIVAKLESLQARSCRAREALDAVPPLLEKLRQSILAAAFRGDLTKDWRAKHPDVEPTAKLLRRIPKPPEPSRAKSRSIAVLPGDNALSVGDPGTPTPRGWKWVSLIDVARLESGHTPSRRHPEWWGGKVPWIGIKDARDHHGRTIMETRQTTNAAGLANSAARLLPKGTVCLSRTATIGYVTVMGQDMATSQDFVNWVCTEAVEPHWLKWLFVAEKRALLRYSSQSTNVATIFYPELLAFHVCLPPPEEQQEIVRRIERLLSVADRLEHAHRTAANQVPPFARSILAKAFRGELVAQDPNDEPAEAMLTRIRRDNGFPAPAGAKPKREVNVRKPSLAEASDE